MLRRPSVEIAGAGLAGLAGAVAFAQRGWRVRVWEQSSELREIGAGLYVWENGLRVLEALGVLEALARTAQAVGSFEVRDERCRLVERFDYSQERGSRLFTMLRPTLHATLHDAAQSLGVEIVTGCKAIGADPSGELHFEDGSSVRADLVVGADGVHSRVRDSVGLIKSKRTLRDGATRMLIRRTEEERASPEATKCVEYWSGTRRVLYTPCHDDHVYLALVGRNDDERATRVPVDVESWSESFPHLEHLFRRVTSVTEARWDRFSMVRLESWHKGLVAICGDAAHAQPPNLGQGACLAMSNMLALAVAADADRADLPRALAAWEHRERPLVEHTQRWTYLWGLLSTTCPRGFDRLRSPFVSWLGGRKSIQKRLARAATCIPTGTD
jgi:2-polyprenyl-6-methoxyphenol hydroxylase-like FAD-dependent oxidoreductase